MNPANIIGIDPGSSNLGLGIITLDMDTLTIMRTEAYTIKGDKSDHYDWVNQYHPDRVKRIKAIESELYQALIYYKPIMVASESPFFGRFAQAFMVLVEVMDAIKDALWHYNNKMCLQLIDPPSVKNALGAKGAAKKEGVAMALSLLTHLNLCRPVAVLDEHSVDAIGVAYGAYKHFLGAFHEF